MLTAMSGALRLRFEARLPGSDRCHGSEAPGNRRRLCRVFARPAHCLNSAEAPAPVLPSLSVRYKAVDLRRSSPSFGRWVGEILSAENGLQMWIPPGFAHGFVVLGERAQCLYKTTDYWYPEFERTLLWNDPAVGIDWPVGFMPRLADKDAAGRLLSELETFA